MHFFVYWHIFFKCMIFSNFYVRVIFNIKILAVTSSSNSHLNPFCSLISFVEYYTRNQTLSLWDPCLPSYASQIFWSLICGLSFIPRSNPSANGVDWNFESAPWIRPPHLSLRWSQLSKELQSLRLCSSTFVGGAVKVLFLNTDHIIYCS